MGQRYSSFENENEKQTWKHHFLQFDHQARETNLGYVEWFKNGEELKLCYVLSTWGNVEFEHWFLTDGKIKLEFGKPNMNVYLAKVVFDITPPDISDDRYPAVVKVATTCQMNDEIRQRICHVLGMCNYSLCLRNSEHVANYIFRGQWISNQMHEGETLSYWIQKGSKSSRKKAFINSFPSTIRPYIFNENKTVVYSKQFMKENNLSEPFTATNFQYYLDFKEKTYNIVVIGPTGAGKSHLINVMFNQKICEETVSLHSVTKEIYFVCGKGNVWSRKRKYYKTRSIAVADTVGLCDTDSSDGDVFNLIKNRISSNMNRIDAVVVVFNGTQRMEKEHVNNINLLMNWLKYDKNENFHKFCFVATHGEGLKDFQKKNIIDEAQKMLGIKRMNKEIGPTKELVKPIFFTGFPSEEDIPERQLVRVAESWRVLRQYIEHPFFDVVAELKCPIM